MAVNEIGTGLAEALNAGAKGLPHGTFSVNPESPTVIGDPIAAGDATGTGSVGTIGGGARTVVSVGAQPALGYAAAFDEAKFRAYVGEDDALLLKVVRRFLADAPGRVRSLQAAVRSRDTDVVLHIAHSLKGSVSYLAAARVLAAAGQLDSIARTADWGAIEPAGTTLVREMTLLVASLEVFLSAAGRPTEL